MRVKVCGLKLLRDVRLAEAVGAAYVGFVVEADSPRALPALAAALLARASRAPAVYVTVDMPPEHLVKLVRRQRPAAVQLHGRETPAEVADLRAALPAEVEIWKALALEPEASETQVDDLLAQADEYARLGVARLLLDTRRGERSGGTGVALPRALAAQFVARAPRPCILAGGLSPADLPEVWQMVQPWALDLSSGLEAKPGVKDPAKLCCLGKVLASSAAS
jgi:phosphoribosylanthranilate isomerase